MVKVLHKIFKNFVNELENSLLTLVELGSEVSQLIPETRSFVEVTRLQVDVKILGWKQLWRK